MLAFVLIVSNVSVVNAHENKSEYQMIHHVDTLYFMPQRLGGALSNDYLLDENEKFDWSKLSNHVISAKLNAKQRQLYDCMYAVLNNYLKGKLSTIKEDGYYLINEEVKADKISDKSIESVFNLVMYENPQFFFLNPVLFQDNKKALALAVYPKFHTKKGLKAGKSEILSNLDWYIASVVNDVNLDSQDEIAEYIAKKLYKGIVYDDAGLLLLYKSGKDLKYTQSIYSALVDDKTVCAGYSKLYEALLNYFDIDCIVILGDNHAWNQVKFGTKWYAVDLTNCTEIGDWYYMNTKSSLKKLDIELVDEDNHVPLAVYKKYAPKLTNTEYIKTYKAVEKAPTVNVENTRNGYKVTLQSVTGSAITYQIGGNGKVQKYTEPFIVKRNKNLLVIATAKNKGTLRSKEVIYKCN